MTQDRRSADFRALQDAQVARVRKGAERPVAALGYAPGGDALRTKALPGDQKFPFVKDVPDVEGPFRLLPDVDLSNENPPSVDNPIPAAPFATSNFRTELAVTETIDVRGIRLLTLLIAYYPASQFVVGELILIPEIIVDTPPAAAGVPQSLYPIGVVDPTITAPGTFPQCFGRRTFYATELNESAGVILNMATDGPCRSTLTFAVESHNDIRFYFGDRIANANSGLELFFLLER